MLGVWRAAVALVLLATPCPRPGCPIRTGRCASIVPFPAGGSADVLCRIVGEKLRRPGASRSSSTTAPARAAMSAPRSPIAPSRTATRCCAVRRRRWRSTTISTRRCPMTGRSSCRSRCWRSVPNVISARFDLPASSLKELIAYAKANPGKVTYASQGNGSTSHLSAQMLATMAGIEIVHVPYKGEGPALVDLTAGRVDIFIGNISAALRFEKTRQAKFLGLASRTRSPVAPDVPTTAELGLPDLIAITWFAVVAPPARRTPSCRR